LSFLEGIPMPVPASAHCRVRVSDVRSAVPRLVSVVHARGLTLEHLHVEGTAVCLAVRGAGPARVAAVLERLVDVADVQLTSSCQQRPSLPTRYLVWREELPAAG
jgi:hypothetical protein